MATDIPVTSLPAASPLAPLGTVAPAAPGGPLPVQTPDLTGLSGLSGLDAAAQQAMAPATTPTLVPVPTEILSQLRDIRGLDPVSWWPPALGWWLLAGLILLLLYLAWRYRASLRLRIPPIPVLRIGNWRWDAGRQLRDLRQRAAAQDPKRTAVELSELLRRVAMARLGREACAGLVGEAWLAWLAEQDPKGFDWRTRGRPLLDAPYAPPAPVRVADPSRAGPSGRAVEGLQDWLVLIDAAYQWVLVEDKRRV